MAPIVGTCDIEKTYGVKVSGDYAYIANITGLVIVDISEPPNSYIISIFETGGYANEVVVSGQCAYIADAHNGLVILDISDKKNPVLIGYAFISDATNKEIKIYNISPVYTASPSLPVFISKSA
mgnify:CR=1 FL=1